MNLKVSQQILHSKGKKKNDPFFCAKNCGHAGSASSGPKLLIYFLLLTNLKENCGPPGWPGPKGYEGQFPGSPWLAVQRFCATICSSFHGVYLPLPTPYGRARPGSGACPATLLPLPLTQLCVRLNCGLCRRTCRHSY